MPRTQVPFLKDETGWHILCLGCADVDPDAEEPTAAGDDAGQYDDQNPAFENGFEDGADEPEEGTAAAFIRAALEAERASGTPQQQQQQQHESPTPQQPPEEYKPWGTQWLTRYALPTLL